MPPLPRLLRLVHWLIIVNFLLEIGYGGYMVFFALKDEEGGPLMDRAGDMPFEKMVTRRLYATETWIAIGGLSIYLAITEFLPRLLNQRGKAGLLRLFV